MTERLVGPIVLSALEYVWQRVRGCLDGMDTNEYLWEPVAGCWTVKLAADGSGRAPLQYPEPDPPPVTTIAWRTYHLGVDALERYSDRLFGTRATDLEPDQWFLDPDHARGALDAAWATFGAGVDSLGEDGMWRAIGPAWGPYAEETHAALLLHLFDELSHHGAEISLLRDLYRNRKLT